MTLKLPSDLHSKYNRATLKHTLQDPIRYVDCIVGVTTGTKNIMLEHPNSATYYVTSDLKVLIIHSY